MTATINLNVVLIKKIHELLEAVRFLKIKEMAGTGALSLDIFNCALGKLLIKTS
jgi:hypothetical protein